MLYDLYNKFSTHYPGYLFGYRYTDLAIKLSVLDKNCRVARKTVINLEATEDEAKLAWYTLLKELQPSEVSEGR